MEIVALFYANDKLDAAKLRQPQASQGVSKLNVHFLTYKTRAFRLYFNGFESFWSCLTRCKMVENVVAWRGGSVSNKNAWSAYLHAINSRALKYSFPCQKCLEYVFSKSRFRIRESLNYASYSWKLVVVTKASLSKVSIMGEAKSRAWNMWSTEW